nr:low-density lipoprotein receptor class A domain-containing protein 4 [Cavia porcellus]
MEALVNYCPMPFHHPTNPGNQMLQRDPQQRPELTRANLHILMHAVATEAVKKEPGTDPAIVQMDFESRLSKAASQENPQLLSHGRPAPGSEQSESPSPSPGRAVGGAGGRALRPRGEARPGIAAARGSGSAPHRPVGDRAVCAVRRGGQGASRAAPDTAPGPASTRPPESRYAERLSSRPAALGIALGLRSAVGFQGLLCARWPRQLCALLQHRLLGNTFFLSLEDLVFHISSAPFLVPCGCSVLCSAGGPSIQRCPLCVTCTSVVIVGGTFTAGDLGAQTLSQLSFRSHCPLWRAQLCLQQLVGRIVCKSRESRAKALSQESVFASGYFRILDSRPCLKRLGTGREHSAPSCSPPDSGVLRAVLEGSSFKVLWSLLAAELEFTQIIIIIVVVTVMVVVIICLLSHYKVSTHSFIQQPGPGRRQGEAVLLEGYMWPSNGAVLRPQASEATIMPRDRFGSPTLAPALSYARPELDLPPTISLADGEEPPRYLGACATRAAA